ncbi:hypothetical protein NEOC65_000082 [Neochlamydia sp. AcF65]|nr:hypothetical protein [Neochlamydia sp. AcF65]MBS4170983.1 hypothetical protein [Neochlamydia sp. AcF95]
MLSKEQATMPYRRQLEIEGFAQLWPTKRSMLLSCNKSRF